MRVYPEVLKRIIQLWKVSIALAYLTHAKFLCVNTATSKERLELYTEVMLIAKSQLSNEERAFYISLALVR